MTRRELLFAGAAGIALAQHSIPSPFISAVAAAEAIRKRTVSSVELTKLCFERMDQYNPRINAIVWRMEAEALKRAAEADSVRNSREPFHGVPVTIKESFAIAGTPSTWGLAPFKDARSTFTATAVERLERAGAIVVGKTNVPVMLSDAQSYNPVYGTTNNPWDLKRSPGGSTGGGAAALAAGIGYLSIGSDIGGSLRIPPDFCGVYGHKPTLGVVSIAGHAPPMIPRDAAMGEDSDLLVTGPLARSAEDLREAMKALGGPVGDLGTAYRWSLPEPRQKHLRDFRVGFVIDDAYSKPSAEVLAILESAVREIEKAGAKMEHGWPAGFDPNAQAQTYLYLMSAFLNSRLSATERAQMRGAYQQNPTDPYLAAVFEPHSRWVAETDKRYAARAAWQNWFKSHDVMLTPVTVVPAFPHDHSEPQGARVLQTPEGRRPYLDVFRWAIPASPTGLPATVAPIGRTAAGLPVGIQIIGPFLEDATPIEFAALLKEVVGGFEPPPGFG